MKKAVFNDPWEDGKWEITQKFVDEHVDESSRVFEGFAGFGFITSMYASRAGQVVAVEKNAETFSGLEGKLTKNQNVRLVNANSLDYMKKLERFDFNVVDLDPWSNANGHVQLALGRMKSGYLLVTSGEPYAIRRFKTQIKKYGEPYIDSVDKFPEKLFGRFIRPTAESHGKKAELLDSFNSPVTCRLVVEIK